GAADHFQHPQVVDTAALGIGGIAGEAAAANRRRSTVEDAAAVGGGIAGEGAVPHRHDPATVVVNAAAEAGVIDENATRHRHRTSVKDAAAIVGGNATAIAVNAGIASSDRHAGKANGLTAVYREDGKQWGTRSGVSLDCQIRGPWPLDDDVVVQGRQSTGQIDRALDGELDDVTVAGVSL